MNLFSTIGAQISGSVWTLANVKADKTYVFNCPQVLAEKGSFLLGSTCACRPGDVFRSNFMPLIWGKPVENSHLFAMQIEECVDGRDGG